MLPLWDIMDYAGILQVAWEQGSVCPGARFALPGSVPQVALEHNLALPGIPGSTQKIYL